MWVARDEDGRLCLYMKFPRKTMHYWVSEGDELFLPSVLFPDVTWENNPMKVELREVSK